MPSLTKCVYFFSLCAVALVVSACATYYQSHFDFNKEFEGKAYTAANIATISARVKEELRDEKVALKESISYFGLVYNHAIFNWQFEEPKEVREPSV